MLVVPQGQILAFDVDGGIAAAGYITLAVHAHPLRRPRRPDRGDHDLPGDLRRARPARDAGGDVRQVEPRDDDLVGRRSARASSCSRPTSSSFVLGDEWEPAVVLLQGLAVATALQQLGFNWFSFYRARGDSRPQAVEAGVDGGRVPRARRARARALGRHRASWSAGRSSRSPCSWSARATCAGCCPACGSGRSGCAALAPVAAGAAVAVALRLALWGGERPLWQVLCELALFLGVTAICTRQLERDLLREFTRYLRTGNLTPAAA